MQSATQMEKLIHPVMVGGGGDRILIWCSFGYIHYMAARWIKAKCINYDLRTCGLCHYWTGVMVL